MDDILGAGIIVDVDRDATESGDFGRQLVETGVVLTFALVGFCHGGDVVTPAFPSGTGVAEWISLLDVQGGSRAAPGAQTDGRVSEVSDRWQ